MSQRQTKSDDKKQLLDELHQEYKAWAMGEKLSSNAYIENRKTFKTSFTKWFPDHEFKGKRKTAMNTAVIIDCDDNCSDAKNNDDNCTDAKNNDDNCRSNYDVDDALDIDSNATR